MRLPALLLILISLLLIFAGCVTRRPTDGGAVYTLPDDQDEPKKTERVWIWNLFKK